jgi:hypothetical protein
MPMSENIEETATIETLEKFFSDVSYKELYSLPPEVFFKQVMIRDRYFSIASTQYSKNKSTFIQLIKMMLKGYVILDENIFEKYTPENVKVSFLPPPKGINILSFGRSLSIGSDLLGLVDTGYLTLKGVSKDDNLHGYFYYPSKKNSPEENVLKDGFSVQSYQDVMTNNSFENERQVSDIILEVDIKTPEEELVKNFREIIRARKELYEHHNEKIGNIEKLIEKCKTYKVIEAYDILEISKLLNVKIKYKKLASIIYEEWRGEKSDDDYRKTTKKYSERIFDQSYYTQLLK